MFKNISIIVATLCISISCKKNNHDDSPIIIIKKDTIVQIVDEPLKDYRGELVKINNDYDNYARFIACMAIKDKRFDSLTSSEIWRNLSHSDDSIWQHLEADRFSIMRDFAKTELNECVSSEKNILYPFSGPDFVNAYTFFPNGKTYTMIALEPVGDLVDFTKKDKEYADEYLYNVNEALEDLYKKSYFITAHMGGHLQKHKANGTLPLISLFMVRTGNKILNIQRVTLDSSGNYTLDSLNSKSKSKARAVRIDFIHDGNIKDVKSLFYFQADMTDPGLKKNKGLIPFLKSFNNCVGYYKSASYCCFDPIFSSIKNTMLEKCDHIVQDDTGIPFKEYNNKKWEIHLYGAYAKPVRDFGSYTYQKDLAAAYKDTTFTVKELPFSLGYHWGSKNQNLLYLKKVK